jgi:hypothetical protein
LNDLSQALKGSFLLADSKQVSKPRLPPIFLDHLIFFFDTRSSSRTV